VNRSTRAILALVLIASSSVAEAKTTKVFSGKEPYEVERAAKQAGYEYSDDGMKCTPRCRQRWAKD
jgi:hypothetical protein